MVRKAEVAGAFYPNSSDEIVKLVDYFSKVYDEHFGLPNIKPKAIISPHAGYVYSGFSANAAYRVLKNSGYKRFLVIGPSHRIGFYGSSICDFDAYKTPFGDIKADKDLFSELKEEFNLLCYPAVEGEHSTETQFPFLKYYIPDATMLELVYSQEESYNIYKIIKYVLAKGDIGVIISTDLSHFYDIDEANFIDKKCLKAVEDYDKEALKKCEACGKIGVEAMIDVASELGLKSVLLDYRTSADFSGDTSRVVGYMSAAFY